MPKYRNGERCCWSMASQSRSSAAIRSSNQCRIGSPSLRSGVAVSPSSSTGSRWSSTRSYDAAAAWWNSSTMTTSKWSGGRASRSAAFRLWIDAKTCSKRVGRAPPTHFSPNDGVPKRVAERGEALVEDLLAVGDEQQPRPGEALAELAVVERGHHGLAGAGRRDEQVAVVALAVGTARSARAAAPGTGSGRSSIGLRITCGPAIDAVRRAAARLRTARRRTARSRRSPSSSRTRRRTWRGRPGSGPRTPGRSTRGRSPAPSG